MSSSNKAYSMPMVDYQLMLSLAELLGWTNIVYMGHGAFLGRPPEGSPHSREQALIPNWIGDFNESIPLAMGYGIYGDKALMRAEQLKEVTITQKHAMKRALVRSVITVIKMTKGEGGKTIIERQPKNVLVKNY